MKIANIGLDGTLWDGGLGFEIDAFYRLREDILALPDSDIPFHFGASLPKTNLNSRDNRGFDLMLKHKGKIGNVSYNINPMVSYSRGKYVNWEENILPTTGVDAATAKANAESANEYAMPPCKVPKPFSISFRTSISKMQCPSSIKMGLIPNH